MFNREILVFTALALCSTASSFVVRPSAARKSTTLFLEDWVANFIDDELYRENHRKEYEQKWMEKNRNVILQNLNVPETVDGDDDDWASFRQAAKDKKLAREDPIRYCADRCIATGNCDVYEDIFKLDAEQVLAFCNNCVLDETKEECDLPDAFLEFGGEDVESTFKP